MDDLLNKNVELIEREKKLLSNQTNTYKSKYANKLVNGLGDEIKNYIPTKQKIKKESWFKYIFKRIINIL